MQRDISIDSTAKTQKLAIKHARNRINMIKPALLSALSLAIACLTSCTSTRRPVTADSIISAPFRFADNILQTTAYLDGRQPAWVKRVTKLYADPVSGAKTVFPKGYNYGSVSWSGGKDAKGFAEGQGTLKTYTPSGAYAFSVTGEMNAGRWVGINTETDKDGKDWKCTWNSGICTSRERIYTSQELEQQRVASIENARRQKLAREKIGRWIAGAMANSRSGVSSSSGGSASSMANAGSNYEDCICTFDESAGMRARNSGYNTIRIRSSRGSWTIGYYFGETGYQIKGSGGTLQGKTINVRFDNGKPASLKCYAGSGYCKVSSASRN